MEASVIENKLNLLYDVSSKNYNAEVGYWKSQGCRIYRNENGEHRVIPPTKINNQYSQAEINEAFGSIFGDIFRGGKHDKS